MENKKYGSFAISRKLKNSWLHPSSENRKFTRYEAWIWIIENANFACSEPRVVGNKIIIVPRGYLVMTVDQLAVIFRWNRRTVEQFLVLLAKDMKIKRYKIAPKSRKSCTLLKVNNYNEYQPEIASICTSKYKSKCKLNCTSKCTPYNNIIINNNNIIINNKKNIKKSNVSTNVDNIYSDTNVSESLQILPYRQNISCSKEHDNNKKNNVLSKESTKEKTQRQKEKPKVSDSVELDFDSFWESYPRKESRANALKVWPKALKKVSKDKLLEGLERYKAKLIADNTERRYTKLASTWLNGECWNDNYDDPAKPQKHPMAGKVVNGGVSIEEIIKAGEY